MNTPIKHFPDLKSRRRTVLLFYYLAILPLPSFKEHTRDVLGCVSAEGMFLVYNTMLADAISEGTGLSGESFEGWTRSRLLKEEGSRGSCALMVLGVYLSFGNLALDSRLYFMHIIY